MFYVCLDFTQEAYKTFDDVIDTFDQLEAWIQTIEEIAFDNTDVQFSFEYVGLPAYDYRSNEDTLENCRTAKYAIQNTFGEFVRVFIKHKDKDAIAESYILTDEDEDLSEDEVSQIERTDLVSTVISELAERLGVDEYAITGSVESDLKYMDNKEIKERFLTDSLALDQMADYMASIGFTVEKLYKDGKLVPFLEISHEIEDDIERTHILGIQTGTYFRVSTITFEDDYETLIFYEHFDGSLGSTVWESRSLSHQEVLDKLYSGEILEHQLIK